MVEHSPGQASRPFCPLTLGLRALGLLVLGAALGAQELPPPAGPAPRRPLDRVLITVRNQVILESDVNGEFQQLLAGYRAAGEVLTPLQQTSLWFQVYNDWLNKAIQAQSYTPRDLTPTQMEEWVETLMKQRLESRVNQIGSVNKMRQQSGLLGRSQYVLEQQEQNDIRLKLYEQEIFLRYRDRLALMITPKALRKRYLELREPGGAMEPTTAQADLAILRLTNSTAPEAARALAEQVVEAWRAEDTSSADMADRFDQTSDREATDPTAVNGFDRLGETSATATNLPPFVAAFVDEAQAGQVTDPQLFEGAFWVVKALSWAPGNDFRYDDPEVQALVREDLAQKELIRMREQLDLRALEKVHVWEARRR